MENTALRKLLKSLCTDSPWSYAVFWKLDQQNYLQLNEDGYCNDLMFRQSISDNWYSNCEEATDSYSETNVLDASSREYHLGLVIADMSCHQYDLGEGLVGRVAYGHDHLWIYSDDTESNELISKLEQADAWLLMMIMAGVKTTLLAPILPYGVVQLGSFDKVVENVAEVGSIKSRVTAALETCTMPHPSSESMSLCSSDLMQLWQRTHDTSYTDSSALHKLELNDAKLTNVNDYVEDEFSVSGEAMIPFFDGDQHQLLSSDQLLLPNLPWGFDVDEYVLDQLVPTETPETMICSNIWAIGHQEDECYYDRVLVESPTEIGSILPSEESKVASEHHSITGCRESEYLEGFPMHLDSQNILGSAFHISDDQLLLEASDTIFEREILPLDIEPYWWSDRVDYQEQLLETVVSRLCSNSSDSSTHRHKRARSSVTPLEEINSCQEKSPFVATTAQMKDDTTCVNLNNASHSSYTETFSNSSTSPSSFDNLTSKINDNGQSRDSTYEQFNTKCKLPKLRKVKAEQENKIKPRPRDRQLIQDRLSELRDLVPNVEKCSIDSVLEQTINHMRFLKKVTEHAENLKALSYRQITSGEAKMSSRSQNCNTSCNHKFGNHHRSCPIIVEELEHTGQILIRMLCDNDEIFYDVTEVMHRLKLTILKGVMEACCQKWAHFVVQASTGFNRLDIFWPLMRILQKTGNWNMDNLSQ